MSKRKRSFDVIGLAGAVFTFGGVILTPLGIAMFIFFEELAKRSTGNAALLPWVFTMIGLICLGLGITFLVNYRKRRTMIRDLYAKGQYIFADVLSIVPDYSQTFNGRPTYVLQCGYTDPRTGERHIFRSERQTSYPDLRQGVVKVYFDPVKGFDRYYVDVASALAIVTEY